MTCAIKNNSSCVKNVLRAWQEKKQTFFWLEGENIEFFKTKKIIIKIFKGKTSIIFMVIQPLSFHACKKSTY